MTLCFENITPTVLRIPSEFFGIFQRFGDGHPLPVDEILTCFADYLDSHLSNLLTIISSVFKLDSSVEPPMWFVINKFGCSNPTGKSLQAPANLLDSSAHLRADSSTSQPREELRKYEPSFINSNLALFMKFRFSSIEEMLREIISEDCNITSNFTAWETLSLSVSLISCPKTLIPK